MVLLVTVGDLKTVMRDLLRFGVRLPVALLSRIRDKYTMTLLSRQTGRMRVFAIKENCASADEHGSVQDWGEDLFVTRIS